MMECPECGEYVDEDMYDFTDGMCYECSENLEEDIGDNDIENE